MRIALIVIAVFIAAYVVYEVVRVSYLVRVSAGLVRAATPYQSTVGTSTLLVLGDSTAVGVGSPSDETVAARLGTYLHASVENYAVSGAVTADLASQLAQAKQEHYDHVLIQIGANDIIRLRSLDAAKSNLGAILEKLAPRAGHVVFLTAGRVGEAPLFPVVFRPFLNARAAALRTKFIALADTYGAAYVDLYVAPIGSVMSKDPARYYAPDGLHLTGEGYGLWYDYVKTTIDTKWGAK